MIINDFDIDELRKKKVNKGPINIVGHPIDYYFVSTDGVVCGLPAKIVDMRESKFSVNQEFYVSLAIESSIKGYYVTEKDLLVKSIEVISLEDNTKSIAICDYKDVDKIRDTINANSASIKPKLTLVTPNKENE